MKNLQMFPRCLLGGVSFAVVFTLSSCEKPIQKRTYDEVVTFQDQKEDGMRAQALRDPHQLLQEMIARGEDPHAFMQTHPTMTESLRESTESPISWKVPAGWKEKAAGGMRLASFTSPTDSNLDISIVSLSGAAGGVSANINRWMNQMHLVPLNEEELNQFLSQQEKFTTENGLIVTMVDFSALLPEGDQSLSRSYPKISKSLSFPNALIGNPDEAMTGPPTTPILAFTRKHGGGGDNFGISSSMLAAIIQLPDKTIFVKMMGTIGEINKHRGSFRELCQSLKIR